MRNGFQETTSITHRVTDNKVLASYCTGRWPGCGRSWLYELWRFSNQLGIFFDTLERDHGLLQADEATNLVDVENG
jgi:hypothetical protein